jgi:hypothetical protein
MRYWLDTEFIEDGHTIDLISIGIVAEDGRELYLCNKECDFCKASDWVWENVLNPIGVTKLPLIGAMRPIDPNTWVSKLVIRGEVAEFLGADCFMSPLNPVGWNRFLYDLYAKCPKWLEKALKEIPGLKPRTYFKPRYKLNTNKAEPEFWAYYADYDWVVFCQLFGTMMDLPEGFPMYCRDVKQECDRLGNPELPKQGKGEHNALADARWNKLAWEHLQYLDALTREAC